MKVLHITEALGGGVQSAIRLYIEATPDHKHFILGRRRPDEDTGTLSAEQVLTIAGSRARFISTIRPQISLIEPDILHLHSSFAGLARFSRRHARPVVYSPHCFAFERTDLPMAARRIIWLVEKALTSRTDFVFGVSPHEIKLAKELGAEYTALIPNVVAARRNRSRPSTVRNRVITIGRIGAQKDPLMYAMVAGMLPHLQFIWIGDGDAHQRARLEQAGVQCLGWCSKDEVDRALLSADLYLHTAAWEAAPLAVAEAVATGIPVLARTIESMTSLGYPQAGSNPKDIALSVDRYFRDSGFQELVNTATRVIAKRSDGGALSRALYQGYELAYQR